MLEVVLDFWLYDANVQNELCRGSSIKNERRPRRLRQADYVERPSIRIGLGEESIKSKKIQEQRTKGISH